MMTTLRFAIPAGLKGKIKKLLRLLGINVGSALPRARPGGPHFIGMGAQKAATTWLFKMLSMHPEVYFPKGKEVAYWNAPFDKREHIATYLNSFRQGAAAAFGGINGDITPLYMIIPEDDISYLHETLPDVRLLFIARNPVERAVSSADFHVRFYPEAKADYDGLLTSPFITNCGMYMKYLDNWLKYFPREQLHVIIQDDIRKNPRKVIAGVAKHLDIDPSIWMDLPKKYLHQRANAATQKTKIDAAMEARLKEIYREDVKRFSEFLGRDLTHWVA